MPAVVSGDHARAAQRVRAALARYEEKRDLVILGAHERGGDPRLDQALAVMPDLERFLRQGADDATAYESAVSTVTALGARLTA
jgi:flagellum-specific ATP synthase